MLKSNQTVQEALVAGSKKLAHLESPRLEAKALMAHVLHTSSNELVILHNILLTKKMQNKYESLVERRAKGEPFAYIVGTKEFFGLPFYVNKAVLIPRPDTETIVELLLKTLQLDTSCRLLELGTGSGCISISLLKHLSKATALATDLSRSALKIAHKNSMLHKVEGRLSLAHCNWYKGITGKFDLIISNPPYVNRLDSLEPELRFEPKMALFTKGLSSYKHIAAGVRKHLNPEGKVYVEIGHNMQEAVSRIFELNALKLTQVYNDLSGKVRYLEIAA